MSILSRVEHSALRAEVMHTPIDDYWYNPVGASTYAGLPVSPDVAMRVSAVFGCVEVLSMGLASLPLRLMRRLPDGGKERASGHPLYSVVGRRPNSWQTRFEFVEGLVRQLFLRGGAFAEKVQGPGGSLDLVPVHPDRVTVEQLDNRRLRYRITPPMGKEYSLSQDEMLHIRDASEDAIAGLSRTILAREAISVAAAAERFSGRWLQNDGSGRVVMKHPAKLDEKTRAEIHRAWAENNAGWANRGKMLLAEGGVTVESLPGLEESGFLTDPRKFQIVDICRFFGRVPPFMIGHEDKITWGTNIEQIKAGFVAFCLKPVGDRIEQAMMRDLLEEDEQEDYFIQYDYSDILRGDLLSVVQAIAIEHQHGLLSPNEGRAMLNLNPRTDPGGDVYQETPAGAPPNNPRRRASDAPLEPKAEPGSEDEEAGAVPAPLLADAVDRIANAELREVERHLAAAAEDPAKFGAWASRFYGKHRAYALKVLAPLGMQFGLAHWVMEAAASRIQATALQVLAEGAPPEGWTVGRPEEIAEILEETFRVAAAASRAA